MARGADETAWRRVRSLAEVITAQWSTRDLPGAICNPYYVRPPKQAVNTPRNQRAMAALLKEM